MSPPLEPKKSFESNSSDSIQSIKNESFEQLRAPSEKHEELPKLSTNHTRGSTRIDEYDMVNLPFRTTTNPDVTAEEYTEETTEGYMVRTMPSNKTGKIERYELVTWKVNDPENPKNWSKAYKWWCTMTVAITCFVVAFNSAVITADIRSPAAEFGVSEEVMLLSITLFVIGFGVGKLTVIFFSSQN
jgi:hypothetical protein